MTKLQQPNFPINKLNSISSTKIRSKKTKIDTNSIQAKQHAKFELYQKKTITMQYNAEKGDEKETYKEQKKS